MRELLAANLARLMDETPEKGTPRLLSKVARWPEGSSKAGDPVSPRIIRYVLDTRDEAPPYSPTLDLVVALAEAFKVPPWQLLADDRLLKLWNLGKLFTISEAVTDKEVEKHLPFPPEDRPTVTPGKRRRKGAK